MGRSMRDAWTVFFSWTHDGLHARLLVRAVHGGPCGSARPCISHALGPCVRAWASRPAGLCMPAGPCTPAASLMLLWAFLHLIFGAVDRI